MRAPSSTPPTCRSRPTWRTASATAPADVAETIRARRRVRPGRRLDRGLHRRQGARPLSARRSPCSAIAAAVAAARSLAVPGFVLTARAENFLRGNPDLDDTIARLQAFEAAGADVLFAPGLPDLEAVRAVCAALKKPFNFMVGIKGKSCDVADARGGRRSPHQPRRPRSGARRWPASPPPPTRCAAAAASATSSGCSRIAASTVDAVRSSRRQSGPVVAPIPAHRGRGGGSSGAPTRPGRSGPSRPATGSGRAAASRTGRRSAPARTRPAPPRRSPTTRGR